MTGHAPAPARLVALLILFFISPGVLVRNSASSQDPASAVSTEANQSSQAASQPATEGQQGPPSAPIQPAAQPETKLITVWKAGDPESDEIPNAAVPPSLEASATQLGYGLKVQAFPARGFASAFFRAFENHQPPDILIFGNHGILEGVTGIATDPEIRAALVQVTESLTALQGRGRGWEYVIHTSPNHQAARELALRPPECRVESEASAFPEGLREFAVQSASAYLEASPALENVEDPDRLHTDMTESEERRVERTEACGYWGTDHLAFVQATASYTSPQAIGWVNVLMALRKRGDQWRLLAASTDPISNGSFVREIPSLVRLMTKPWTPSSAPAPPSLLTPQDGEFPVPAPGARFGDFSWHTSPSAGEVAEIAEFAYNGDARLFAIFFSGPAPATEHCSTGALWSTGGMWKWRVWSISDTGAVSVSPARSFNH